MADDDHESAENSKHDGEDTGALGDGERRVGDGDGGRAPCGDRGTGERAGLGFHVNDAGVSLDEEDEHGRSKEDRDDRAQTLGNPLLLGVCAEEETDAEVTDQIGGLVSSNGGERASEKVKALGVLGAPVLALCGATEDDLGGLGRGGERGDVGNTGTLDGEEGEEEGKEDREQGHADWHVELDGHDDASADDDQDEQWCPPVPGDQLVGLGRVLDDVLWLLLGAGLHRLAGRAAHLLHDVDVEGGAAAGDGLADKEDDLVLEGQLGEGNGNHEKNTRPQEPVTRRWVVLGGVGRGEGGVADVLAPLWVIRGDGLAESHTLLDERGANDTPGNDGTEEEGEGSVETDEDTGTDEGRGKLDDPKPVLRVDGAVVVFAPDEDPGKWVPVPEDTDGVLGNDTEDQGRGKGEPKSAHLQLSDRLTGGRRVHGADGHGGGGRGREDQAQLASYVDDEELAQRSSESETKVTTDDRQGDETREVGLWVVQEVELVKGRDTGDEDTGETTSGRGGRLDDVVLTGTKVTTENGE